MGKMKEIDIEIKDAFRALEKNVGLTCQEKEMLDRAYYNTRVIGMIDRLFKAMNGKPRG